MHPLQTPDGYAVRFTPDVLEFGRVSERIQGNTTIRTVPMRLWGVLLLMAELRCLDDQTTLVLHQMVAEISHAGQMTVRPTGPWAQFEGARPSDDAHDIGLQTLAFLAPAIGPEARRKRRAMRLTCQALTGLHPTAAQGKLTITANGRLLFQPLLNGWQGIHPPRAFTKVRLPDMRAWIGAALQEIEPFQHGPRLQPALVYQAIRPDGSRHALLAAIDAAQEALREAGLDPTGWFTEPRR